MPPSSSSARLQRILEGLAEAFAFAIVDAFAGATLAELDETESHGPRRDATASKRREGKSTLPRGELLAAIVEHLRARPDGARAEVIRKELGLDKASFVRAMSDGLATEEIRKTGRLRATMYFAA